LLSAKNLFFVVITHKKKKPDLNKCAFHCFFSLMGWIIYCNQYSSF
jgi:hypothetical protein